MESIICSIPNHVADNIIIVRNVICIKHIRSVDLPPGRFDSDFNCILVKLRYEWCYTGASVGTVFAFPAVTPKSLFSIPVTFHCYASAFFEGFLQRKLTLRSVDSTVVGFSPDSLVNIDSLAERALIVSSIAAAIGLFVDVLFVSVYLSASVQRFQVGLFPSY